MAPPRRFLPSNGGSARCDAGITLAACPDARIHPACTSARIHTAIAGLIVVAAACGPGSPNDASSHRFTVTVEDGVEVARTTGGPKYEGEIFAYEKVLTMRPDPDVPESYIGYVGVMTMAEDGTIFVADGQAGRIVALSRDGTFLRTYGRRGQGPGEFRIPALLEIVDGVLWAEDVVGQRSHAFALDGTLQRTVTIPPQARGERGLIDGEWRILSDGRIVISKLGTRRDERHDYLRAEMLVIDTDGDALARAETPWMPVNERIQAADRSETTTVGLQFRGFPEGQYSRDHGFFLMSADQRGALSRALPDTGGGGRDRVLIERKRPILAARFRPRRHPHTRVTACLVAATPDR